MPKSKHSVWQYFECIIKKENSTGKWAKCRECSKEMQGIPSRMEKNILTHQKNTSTGETAQQDSVHEDIQPSTSNSITNSNKRIKTSGNC